MNHSCFDNIEESQTVITESVVERNEEETPISDASLLRKGKWIVS